MTAPRSLWLTVSQESLNMENNFDFLGLGYWVLAAVVSLAVETLRRYVKRRMDIWEAEHPVKDKDED